MLMISVAKAWTMTPNLCKTENSLDVITTYIMQALQYY